MTMLLPMMFRECVRTEGELSIRNNLTQQMLVVAPPGAPVNQIYRDGKYELHLAATEKTQQHLGILISGLLLPNL